MVGNCRCTRFLHRYYHSTFSSSRNGEIVVPKPFSRLPTLYIYSILLLNGFNIIITFYTNTVSNSCYIINIFTSIVYLPAILCSRVSFKGKLCVHFKAIMIIIILIMYYYNCSRKGSWKEKWF